MPPRRLPLLALLRSLLPALLALQAALAGACGATAHGRGDDDDDASADSDADADGDADGDGRPACPEGDDLVLGAPCTDQSACDPPLCGRQGGVCIEETWTCGQCDYCFFTRTPRLDDPSLSCNSDRGLCE